MKTLLIFLFPLVCQAKLIKIAVIDTGFDFSKKDQIKLCETGHKSFNTTSYDTDEHGHGTNVVGLIAKHAKQDYCIIVIKALGPTTKETSYSSALLYLNTIDFDILNISAVGEKYNSIEHAVIITALSKKKVIVAAAGNDSKRLAKGCETYPACLDDRIIVVGNTSKSSNYGEIVDITIPGDDQEALGVKLSGSSQSTAIVTGKIANKMGKK